MLLIALFAVPFATQAQSFFEEDFESSSTGTLPTGWTKMKGGSSVGVSTSYTCSGSHSFKFEGSSESDPVSMVAISGLTVEANTTEMTFSTRNESTYSQCGSFSVGYVTDLTDPNTFVAIETHNASEFNGSCQEFTVAFNSAPAGAYIAFRQTPVGTSYNYYWFIDDIDIHALPTCPKPIGLTFSNITATSADLSWTAGGEESEWELTIHPAVNGDSVFTAYSNSYSFSELTGNTVYSVSCRAVCSSDDSSFAMTTSFRTSCSIIADLPWSEDFETWNTGSTSNTNFDPCWRQFDDGSSSSHYPYVSTSYNHTMGGSKGLYWYMGTSSYTSYPNEMFVVLPEFDFSTTPLTDLTLRVWAKGSSTTPGAIIVGTLDNMDSVNTFEPYDTINVTSSNWNFFDVDFVNFAGTGNIIALKAVKPTSSYTLYVDDISLFPTPTCLDPSDAVATNIGATHADLYWHERGEATAWDIEYHTSQFTPGAGVGTTMQVTSDTVTITDLLPNTTYYVYVRANCGGGDTSMYTSTSFTTQRLSAPVTALSVSNIHVASAEIAWSINQSVAEFAPEYYELTLDDSVNTPLSYTVYGLDTLIGGLLANTTYQVSLYGVYQGVEGDMVFAEFTTQMLGCLFSDPSGTSAGSTSCYAPVYYNYGNTVSEILFTASELTNMGFAAGEIQGVTFDWTHYDTEYDKEFTFYMGQTSQTSLSTSSSISLANQQQVYHGIRSANTNGLTQYTFDTAFVWDGTSSIVLTVFSSQYGGSGTSGAGFYAKGSSISSRVIYARKDSSPYTSLPSSWTSCSYRPNMTFFRCDSNATCAEPAATVNNVTSESADISWVAGYQETSWDVDYKTVADSEWTVAATATADNTVTLTDLLANTTYQVRVGAICDDTTMYTDVSFTTLCAPIVEESLPYVESFETVNNNFACWEKMGGGSAVIQTTNPHEGSNSLKFSGVVGNNMVLLPEFEVATNELEMTLWTRPESTSSSCGTFSIGYVTDVDNVASFVPLATYSYAEWGSSVTHLEKMVSFADAPSSARMALRHDANASNYYWFVDDVNIHFIPTCARIDSLKIDSLSTTTISLSWADSLASAWQIEIGDTAFVPGTGEHDAYSAYETNYTLTDLDSAHTYHIYVMADCNGALSEARHIVATTLSASPATVPYVCDFEQEGSNGWDLINGTQTNAWYVGSATNNGGSRSLYISDDGGTSNHYSTSDISYTMASRTFNLADTGEYAFSYDWRGEGESHYYDYTRVFMAPVSYQWSAGTILGDNTYGFSTYVAPSGWFDLTVSGATPNTLAEQSTWTTATGTFHVSTPGTYNLVFAWANDGSSGTNPPTAIDNVMLVHNTCPQISNLTASYVSADSVTLTWTAGGQEGSWIVSDGVTSEEVYETTHTFENLSPSTAYTFSVSAFCNPDTSMLSNIVVYTACGNITQFPWNEGFESLSADGDLPNCWDNSEGSTSTASYRWSYNSSYGTGFSGKCIRFDSYVNSSGNTNYLKTPILSLPAGQPMQLTFMYKNPTGGDYSVYISTDGGATHTTSIATGLTGVADWTEFEYSLANYAGMDSVCIVFKGTSNYGSDDARLYLDEVSVAPLSSCPKVLNATASAVSPNSIAVSFSDTVDAGSYTIVWGTSSDLASVTDSVTITDTTYTISGLTAQTTYNIWVRTNCANEASNYVTCGAVTTPCDAFLLADDNPFTEDFESSAIGPCWSNFKIAGPGNSDWATSTTYHHNGSRSAYIADQSATTRHLLVSRPLLIPEGEVYQLSFWAYHLSSTSFSTKVLEGVRAWVNTTPDTVGGTALAYFHRNVDLAPTAGFVQYESIIPMDGQVYVIFEGINEYGGSSYIDDVEVSKAPTCYRPYDVVLTNLETTSASLSWSGNGSSYAVEYKTTATSSWNRMVVTDTFATITPLTAQTNYDVRIRALCSATDSSAYSNAISFKTPCESIAHIMLPYTEDFEAYTASSSATIDPCWYRYTSGSSYYPYVSTTYAHSGTKSLYFGSTSYFVALPQFEDSLSNLMLTFYEKYSSTYPIVVGVMTDPSNIATFEPVATINTNSTWTEHQVYFDGYQGNGRHIAFRLGSSGYCYIDDITVSELPSCIDPHDLAVDNITNTSADITWNGNAISYAVEYRPIDSTAWNRIVVSDTFVNLTTLTSATEYEVRVRALCSATDSSDYSHLIEFSTSCDAFLLSATNSFTEDFESTEIGVCWGNFKIAGPGSYPWKTSTTYAHGGSRSGYIQDQSATTRHLLVSRPLMVPEGEFYQLSFWVYQLATTSWSSYVEEGVRAWVNTTPDTVGGTVLAYHHRNVDLGSVSGWIKYEANIPIDGQQIYVIFEGINEYGGASYIDDVEVSKAPSCPRVSNIEVTDATTSSITLDWDDIATPMAWEIEYGQAGFTQGTGTSVVVSSKPATISSLTASTNYAFYIRPICSDSDTGRWIEQPFFAATNCAVVDVNASSPFFQGFESANAPAACWTMVYGNNNPAINPMTHNSDRHYDADSGVVSTRSFRFSSYAEVSSENYNQYLITPELNISGNGVVRFAYSGHTYGEEQFKVGYSTTTNELSAFTWGSEILLDEDVSWHIYNDSIGDSIKYIALHYYSDYQYYVYIDNFSVTSDGGGCSAPAVTSVNQTYENIVMNWTAANDSCEVAITNTVWNDNLPTTLVIGNTYTFANLTPATTYTVGVRQVCGEGVTSAWTTRTVTTDSLPCFAPTALAFVSATYHTATLSWTAGGEETHWNVRIFNTTYDSTYAATSANATFGGLQAGVAYNAQVRAMCGSNGQIEGDWCADTLSFTTADCAPVANLTAAAAATDAIQLSWTNGGIEQAWMIEYADDPDFGQGEGTVVNVNSNPATVTGLEPNTEYFFYVYAQCEEALRSIASNRANATTYDVGINDVNGATSIAIYPNPAQNATTISVSGVEGKVSISIVDLNGRAVFNDNMECEGDCVKTLDVEGLAQGAYFVRIYGENVNSVKKLIVR